MANYYKYGFHVGPTGNQDGIGKRPPAGPPPGYMESVAEAGGKIVIKSTDSIGPLWEADFYPGDHWLVYRMTDRPGVVLDVPDYTLHPHDAAEKHWAALMSFLPVYFDPAGMWLEVANEPARVFGYDSREDFERGDLAANLHGRQVREREGGKIEVYNVGWLGEFMLRASQLAIKSGFKICGPGWAAGEPEPEDWEAPEILQWLSYVEQFPDSLAVSVHEYSYKKNSLLENAGYMVGRFENIFRACDVSQIARPPVLITEAGWTLNNMPDDPGQAMAQLTEAAAQYYDAYPEIKAVYLWTLNGEWQGLDNKLNQLMTPITERAVAAASTPPDPDPPPGGGDLGLPRVQYKRVYHLCHPSLSEADYTIIARDAYQDRRTVGWSFDDAGLGALEDKAVLLFHRGEIDFNHYREWYATHYPGTELKFVDIDPNPPAFETWFKFWPTQKKRITQTYGNNKAYYERFNLKGHEGVDIDAPHGSPIVAVAAGVVAFTGDERKPKAEGGHNYGVRVYIDHGNGYQTDYAHLDRRAVDKGGRVAAGQVIGYADNTGNILSGDSHLHFNLRHKGATARGETDQPYDLIDPTPFLPLTLPIANVEGPEPEPEPPTPPEIARPFTFIRGVDQPASDWNWSEGRKVFDRFGLYPKFHTSGDSFRWWGNYKHPHFNPVRIILNPAFKGGPAEILQETENDIARFYNQGARDFIVWNEPNLAHEGLGIRYETPEDFGKLLAETCAAYKLRFPNVRLWAPGFSPQYGAEHDWIERVKNVNGFSHCFGLTKHVYSNKIYDAAQAAADMLREVEDYISRHCKDKPLIIGEFSINTRASQIKTVDAAYKAEVYRALYQKLSQLSKVWAAYAFTSTWYPNTDPNREGWLENGIMDLDPGTFKA